MPCEKKQNKTKQNWNTHFFVRYLGQAPALKVARIFKIFRAQSFLRVA